eukprot:403367883
MQDSQDQAKIPLSGAYVQQFQQSSNNIYEKDIHSNIQSSQVTQQYSQQSSMKHLLKYEFEFSLFNPRKSQINSDKKKDQAMTFIKFSPFQIPLKTKFKIGQNDNQKDEQHVDLLAIGFYNEVKIFTLQNNKISQIPQVLLFKEIILDQKFSDQIENLLCCDWAMWTQNSIKSQILAFAGILGLIYVFDLSKQIKQEMYELQGHGAAIKDLKFNPIHSHILISASDDKTLRVWNAYLQQQLLVIGQAIQPTFTYFSIDWHSNGRELVASCSDFTLRLFEFNDQFFDQNLQKKSQMHYGNQNVETQIHNLQVELCLPYQADMQFDKLLSFKTYQFQIGNGKELYSQVRFINDLVITRSVNGQIKVVKLFKQPMTSKETQFCDVLELRSIDTQDKSYNIDRVQFDIGFDVKIIKNGSEELLEITTGDQDGNIASYSLNSGEKAFQSNISRNQSNQQFSYSKFGKYLAVSQQNGIVDVFQE